MTDQASRPDSSERGKLL